MRALANLGDVTTSVMGQAPPGRECNKEGVGTVFVKAGEFGEQTPVVREWTTKPLKFAKRGDVLVCVVGATAGKINLGIDCAIGRSVAAIRPNSTRLQTGYLYHFLQTSVLDLRRKSQGLAQGVITRDMLANLEIPLPPLDEQRRIAAILDKADSLRQKRKQAIALLDSLTQSIFLEMFGDPVSNPKGWPMKRLEDLIEISAPMVDPRKSEYSTLLHYGPDRIEKESGRLLPALTAKEDRLVSGKFLCNDRHILYSKIRPYLNKVALCGQSCLCSADVYPLLPVKGVVDRIYIWFLLRSNAFLRYADSCSNRANIPKLNRNQLLSFDAMYPSLDLQSRFSQLILRIQRSEGCLKMAEANANALFAALQHRAFAGEL